MKYQRVTFLLFTDIILVNFAFVVGLLLRYEFDVPTSMWQNYYSLMPIMTGIVICTFYLFGLYKSLWQYAGDDEVWKVGMGSIISISVCIVIAVNLSITLPRSSYIISALLTILLVGGSRMGYRIIRRILRMISSRDNCSTPVLIIGAGDAGAMVIKELLKSKEVRYRPIAVLDDNKWKWNTKLLSVPVKGGLDKIVHICKEENIKEIIIAMPSAGKKRIAEIASDCRKTGCKLKTLPDLVEIINNKVSVKNIREVSIEDLLGRVEVHIDTSEISGYINKETILVTGGGGSIGSELCRQIAKYHPSKLIILDIYENTTYELQNELAYSNKNLTTKVVIASIQDEKRLNEIFDRYKPSVVFHAAAHKHVSLMENNPQEAIKNNVVGTLNVARCADKYGAKKFVLISTDKAVNPTNVMGATKRVAEMIIQSIDKTSKTEFVAVRFGNVLGSNGSVIPIFKKQIAHGGPVTVTHPEVTRYFMTIPEASRLVIQAGAMAKGGEIFVLDMGEPVKIINLAKELISLSGFEPNIDINIDTGLKPGEKLYEELLMNEEGLIETNTDGIFIAKPSNLVFKEVLMKVEMLKNSISDHEGLRKALGMVVPTYRQSLGTEVEQSVNGSF